MPKGTAVMTAPGSVHDSYWAARTRNTMMRPKMKAADDVPADVKHDVEEIDWRMVMALRLAALIYRSRADISLPPIDCRTSGNTLRLGVAPGWLAANPLTITALQEEIEEWAAAGYRLDIKALRELEAGLEAQAA